jgi:hypothetical protein
VIVILSSNYNYNGLGLVKKGLLIYINYFIELLTVGVEKLVGVPEHKNYEIQHTIHERQGDKESPKARTHLKSCEPLYTCPCAPFYRKTKGLLHSENILESKEYS